MSATTTPAATPPAAARPRRPGAFRASKASKAWVYYLLCVALAALFLFPVLWTVLASVKAPAEANQTPPTFIPHHLSGSNYQRLVHYGVGLRVYLTNSVLVALFTVVGTVLVAGLAGYGFSRYRFAGRGVLFVLILAVLMVPYPTILLPLYIVLGKLHLQNTLIGLSLVLIMFQLPFATFMMRNSFDSMPRELEEAALVDGCTVLGALRRVVLRIVMPGLVTVALFAFLAAWNEFLAPLIFLTDNNKYTMPVMLVNAISGTFGTVDWGLLQAGIVLTMLPCIVLFLVLQRYYVSGLVSGALRG
jgi:multiple sugar transport system permease protein